MNEPSLIDQAIAHRRRWRTRVRRVLKPLPRRSNLSRYPGLKYFRGVFRRFPFLWSYRAPESLRAIYLGSVITFLPIMGAQILVGALLSLPFRANLTIVSALQLVSNPLTGPGMYYLSYLVGGKIAALSGVEEFGWAGDAAINLGIGGVICGLALGACIHLGMWLYRSRHHHLLIPQTDSRSP